MKLALALLLAGMLLSLQGLVAAQELVISISPASGPCGSTVRVLGSGFPPNVDLSVTTRFVQIREVGLAPTDRTDGAGNFETSVHVPVAGCPWEQGMVARGIAVVACVLPTCSDQKVTAPFVLTGDAGGLPVTGAGPSDSGNMPAVASTALAMTGVLLIAGGALVYVRRGPWSG